MSNQNIKLSLTEIKRKIELSQLTKEEEVYYLVNFMDFSKKEAEKIVYLGENNNNGVLKD